MSHVIDMAGQTFGMLKVLERVGSDNEGKALWRCECLACGNKNYITTGKQIRRKSKRKTCGCMQGKEKNISGMKFGKLTAIKKVGSQQDHHSIWKCICDCGKYKDVPIQYLLDGTTKSCGCNSVLRGKDSPKAKHLMTKTRLYHVYSGMKKRCYNSNDTYYKYYGGKGIKVCQEWLDDYMNFYNWAIQNGYDENAEYMQCTIDRKNYNGDYCPENCRWVTNSVQAINKSNTLKYEINGITKSLNEWCVEYGIKYSVVYNRLRTGVNIEDALTFPIQHSPTKHKLPRQKNKG